MPSKFQHFPPLPTSVHAPLYLEQCNSTSNGRFWLLAGHRTFSYGTQRALIHHCRPQQLIVVRLILIPSLHIRAGIAGEFCPNTARDRVVHSSRHKETVGSECPTLEQRPREVPNGLWVSQSATGTLRTGVALTAILTRTLPRI